MLLYVKSHVRGQGLALKYFSTLNFTLQYSLYNTKLFQKCYIGSKKMSGIIWMAFTSMQPNISRLF
jgi:hypothetical protein